MTYTSYPQLQAEKEKAEWDKLTDKQKWDKYRDLCLECDQLYREQEG